MNDINWLLNSSMVDVPILKYWHKTCIATRKLNNVMIKDSYNIIVCISN